MSLHTSKNRNQKNSGFGYIDSLVAMFVLTVALLGFLALIGVSMLQTTVARDDLLAKQKAREALEAIFTARNTQEITFDDIRNVSGGGIFLEGFQPLTEPGALGLVGTANPGPPECEVLPGEDETMGTSDDITHALTRFQREIRIRPAAAGGSDLRELHVTIRYITSQGAERRYEVACLISRFR